MATSRTTNNNNDAAAAAEPIPSDGTTPPVEAVTPTTTHYQQLAGEFISELDAITAIIPKLEAQHVSTVNFVRSHLNASTEFLATVITAVEQTPQLQAVGKLDIAAARDTLQFLEAFRPVLDKAMAFARNLQYTLNSRKATLVGDALRMYDVAKAIARDRRDPSRAAIGSHVANMKRSLGRGRPSKATLLKRAAAAALPKEGAAG